MNNTERDAQRRARRAPVKRKVKSKKNIKKHVYDRSVSQSLLMLGLTALYAYKFSYNSGITLIIISVLIVSLMLANAAYMFSTPLVNISTKNNIVSISRNLFFRKKFELSQVMSVSFNKNGDKWSKFIFFDKNYKILGQFYLQEMSDSDFERFIQDIEAIVQENNPKVEKNKDTRN